jgi:YHS domain-containing protein
MNPLREPETAPTPAPILTVCGRVLTGDPRYYPQALYRGRTLYFCTETCLEAFRDDPKRFLCAHRPKEAR